MLKSYPRRANVALILRFKANKSAMSLSPLTPSTAGAGESMDQNLLTFFCECVVSHGNDILVSLCA